MPSEPLILDTDRGLYCPQGDFHIDAWRPCDLNVVTHAHADHARRVAGRYLVPPDGELLLRKRLGEDISVATLPYGKQLDIRGVKLSLHPAGHLLGSAQVRLEYRGEVWVFTGDYKTAPADTLRDSTCLPFELQRCHTFITECTFGLPLYRWRDPADIKAEINQWWRGNVALGRTSVLLAYALGKAQRALSLLDPDVGPILLHGAAHALTETYRAQGVSLPPAEHASPENARRFKGRSIVIAPPGAGASPWVRKFHPESVAIASGWMQLRGIRRRKAADRGFALSDHVDFPNLMRTIRDTGAQRVIATHGYTGPLTRYLRELGLEAGEFRTRFRNEGEGEGDAEDDGGASSPKAGDLPRGSP